MLDETFVAAGVSHARHAAGFSRWFMSHRNLLARTVSIVTTVRVVKKSAPMPQDIRDILREVELAVAREPAKLTEVQGKTHLMQVWNELLIDAAAKVAQDRRDGELYAEYPESDEDREYAVAIEAVTAENWQHES